jgi:hypothetical protein
MKTFFFFVFMMIFAAAARSFPFTAEWSPNHVWKYSARELSALDDFRDSGGLTNDGSAIRAMVDTNAWLFTWSIDVGQRYIPDHAFINMDTLSTDSYAVLTVRDGESDEVLASHAFVDFGRIDLTGIFRTNLALSLEIVGTDAQVFSFGLVRKKLVVAREEDLLVLPGTLFMEEGELSVQFRLEYPASLDVLVFDPYGRLVERLAKDRSYDAGDHFLSWNPDPNASLPSGSYQLYFRARVPGRKPIEMTRMFTYIGK